MEETSVTQLSAQHSRLLVGLSQRPAQKRGVFDPEYRELIRLGLVSETHDDYFITSKGCDWVASNIQFSSFPDRTKPCGFRLLDRIGGLND